MNSNDEQYEILPSDQLLDRMMKLARDYPTFVTLTTTQEWFGLPRAGELYLYYYLLFAVYYGLLCSEESSTLLIGRFCIAFISIVLD